MINDKTKLVKLKKLFNKIFKTNYIQILGMRD